MWYPPAREVKAFPTAALSTSGIRVEGDSFLSACHNKLPCIFSCKNKNRRNQCGSSCKKSICMTSYGGIIRIRLRVEVRLLPLSLLTTSSPVFLFYNTTPFGAKFQGQIFYYK